jgi:hypothetical protein
VKTRILLALAGLSGGFITPAFALVSVTVEQNGKRTELYGANPQGAPVEGNRYMKMENTRFSERWV